jgi:hypothetical protein
MSNRDIEIARLAYRMGRKDGACYAEASVRSAHVDSQTVDKIASLVWASISDNCERDPFEVLSQVRQTKLRFVAHRALEMISAALSRALEESPPDPVSFEAIVRAVDFDPNAPEPLCSRFIEPSVMAITVGANRDCAGNGTSRCQKCARLLP